MLDIIGGLLTGVLKFYAWTVSLGLVTLFLIALIEGAVDFLRDHRHWHGSRAALSRHRA
jgi:hypothetical protein